MHLIYNYTRYLIQCITIFFSFSGVKKLSVEKNNIVIKNEFDVRSYFIIRQQLEDLAKQYHSFIINPKNLIPFCNPGRLVKVS